ncbi:hypothetical protein [Yoonia sp. 208BN28-4]|uniref:hypothetical protein n=1 Tax=Yoonia sp. 208BN28-4 TaxID=3126505 RepID=UPI00309F980D
MRIFATLFVTLLAVPAFAACDAGRTVFMSCSFQNGGKTVEVCASKSTASYRFGPRGGQAELALSVPVSDVDYAPWPGVGSSIFEAVTFYNNTVAYEVYAGVDRNPSASGKQNVPFGGINIFENGAQIATLECDDGSVAFPWTDVLSR